MTLLAAKLPAGLSILLTPDSLLDPEGLGRSIERLAQGADFDFEVVAAVPPGSRSNVAGLRTVGVGESASDCDSFVSAVNLLTFSARYDRIAIATSLDGIDFATQSLSRAVVLAGTSDHDPIEQLRRGASAIVPTVLARATKFRSRVVTSFGEIELRRLEDVWVDFWIRLLSFAPLELTSSGTAPTATRAFTSVEPSAVPNKSELDQMGDELAVACATGSAVRAAVPAAQQICRELLRDSAGRANEIMRGTPALHISAIDLLRRNHVLHFPYDDLNAGLARRLVIAYGYPPFTDTSGLVFARRTFERSQVVDVVSKDLTGRARRDPKALAIVEEFVASQKLIDGVPSFDDWAAISHYCQAGLAAIEELSGGSEYDQIYSRAMWPASHFLAAIYKLKHPKSEWIAEFSDPMRRDPGNGPRGRPVTKDVTSAQLAALLSDHHVRFPGNGDVYEWTEELPYRFADQILFTNAQQLEFMMSYCDSETAESVRAKSTFEHHPSPPASFYGYSDLDLELDPELVHVGYFGVFYPTRGLKSIADAIVSLPSEERNRLRLQVFCPRPIEMDQMAVDAGLESVIVAHPYLAYFDFLQAITQFDCLLVDDYRTSTTHLINPYLPSKWSDYVGSGTPIWRVTEPGSVLSRMRAAYQSDLDDVAGAQRVLDEILEIGPRQQHSANVKR